MVSLHLFKQTATDLTKLVRPVSAVHIGTTAAMQTFMLQLVVCFMKTASQKLPELILLSEFSKTNKFPEISRFSRIVSTQLMSHSAPFASLIIIANESTQASDGSEVTALT